MDLKTKIEAYLDARAAHEEARDEAAELYKTRARIENELIDAMLEADCDSYKHSGTLISLRQSVSMSVTEANRAQTREWLVEELGDDGDYVEEVVSKKAMTELVKDLIDRNIKRSEDFPSFLKVNTRPTLAMRAPK